jgi:hypothetical protein
MSRSAMIALVLGPFFLSACARTSVEPPVNLENLELEFSVDVSGAEPVPNLETTVISLDGALLVRGGLVTGMSGFELEPTLNGDLRRLELVVTAQNGGGVASPALYRYEAKLMGLPPGTYDLHVVHRVPEESREYVALSSLIQLP